MREQDTGHDVIVVGSGGGGLAAAAAAAREGASTLVLEAMPYLGGYLNAFRQKGFTFDTGLHYLGEVGPSGGFRALLERLGAWQKVSFLEINPDCFKEYHFGDFTLRMPAGVDRLRARLVEAFPTEGAAIDCFLARVREMGDIAREAEAAQGGLLASMGLVFRHPSVIKYGSPTYTFAHFLEEITANPKLRAILSGFSGEGGLPPHRASVFAAMVILHFLEGAFYPRGGSGALRDSLVASIREAGGELRVLERVEHIGRSGDQWVVRSNHGEHRGRTVICNADPTLLYGKVLDPALVPARLRKKALSSKPSIGSFCAYVGTDLDLPSLGITDAIIAHADSFDDGPMWDDALAGRLPQDWSGFALTSPSVRDPQGGHAPPGKHNLEVLALCPFEPFAAWADHPSRARGPEYERLKREMGMRLLAKAERYVPGLRDHLEYVEFSTPLSNLYWANAPAGGCYGPAQTPEQAGPLRFPIASEVEGLYLCGAGTIAGGVYPCLLSGEQAARLATRQAGRTT